MTSNNSWPDKNNFLEELTALEHDQYQRMLRNATQPMEVWEVDLFMLELKTILAHYDVFRCTVYGAVYGDRLVTAKVRDWNDYEVHSIRALFREKAAVWLTIDHPNVTKFIGASIMDSIGSTATPRSLITCCVVEEFVFGETLKKFLFTNSVRGGGIPLSLVIKLALDLAQGLSCLHSRNITHYDLRTENIIVLNNKMGLKIHDFVAAEIKQRNPYHEFRGVEYMAPEFLQGKPYTSRNDVYSYGICLWEICCCGQMPYPGLTIYEIANRVTAQNLRPVIPGSCPDTLADIMCRCWDRNPDERPVIYEVVRRLEAIDPPAGDGGVPRLEDMMSGLSIIN